MGSSNQAILSDREQLLDHFQAIRNDSLALCEPLAIEDYVIQTMADVSPPKWHLAHTSWFFEAFLLNVFDPSYVGFNPEYDYLFNSYYVTHSSPYPRPERGLLSRPTVAEIKQYRHYVDQAMHKLIVTLSATDWEELRFLVVLGLNHEQQHQELLLTDIKHIFAHNSLKPVYRTSGQSILDATTTTPLSWQECKGGIVKVGHNGNGFAYDNEGPQHKVYCDNYRLASRLVTNSEYLDFINDKGYQQSEFWLSDGWAQCNEQQWKAPLYWENRDSSWFVFTFDGMRPVDMHAPVCHVSYFEADAYARWYGKRLPTEFEWEIAASDEVVRGNLREQNHLSPLAATGQGGLSQLFGDVWEWTSSPYTAYPGYKPAPGSIGEYNGKFMSSQMVLRGGSFATPEEHIRATYRNFFYPKDRWQFSGIRLADDA